MGKQIAFSVLTGCGQVVVHRRQGCVRNVGAKRPSRPRAATAREAGKRSTAQGPCESSRDSTAEAAEPAQQQDEHHSSDLLLVGRSGASIDVLRHQGLVLQPRLQLLVDVGQGDTLARKRAKVDLLGKVPADL